MVATGNTPEERSPTEVTTEVITEVNTTPANVTLQQEDHGDEESGSEKDEETQPEMMHTDTQEVAPSDSPAVEQVNTNHISKNSLKSHQSGS